LNIILLLQAQCANLKKYDIYALVPTKQDILEVGYILDVLNCNCNIHNKLVFSVFVSHYCFFPFFFLVCLFTNKSRSYYDKTRNFWHKNKSKGTSAGNSKRSVFWDTVRRSFETRNPHSDSSSFLPTTNVSHKYGKCIMCAYWIRTDVRFLL